MNKLRMLFDPTPEEKAEQNENSKGYNAKTAYLGSKEFSCFFTLDQKSEERLTNYHHRCHRKMVSTIPKQYSKARSQCRYSVGANPSAYLKMLFSALVARGN